MDKLIFPRSLYMKIMDTIGKVDAESGGVMAIEGNVISEYYFDINAGVARFYVPSIENITEEVNRWLQQGKAFGGFLHSHSRPYTKLSGMDIVSAEKTMAVNQLKSLYMGIVIVPEKELYLYKVIHQGENSRSIVEQCAFSVM